ncbi:hypothetical protein CWE22_09940 [Pseudidiomarina aestuarii]|uniref:GGDEF domain-containing protein n=1 Tax=Pseudidiomarina aestuarii TaxID=624146 RepID=A0A7Z6ZSQ6_9GAMM|nr:GGDEF domain-containing protein [Pseudidiomarina aestuarii]RUO39603.1 hypothetical protein CWE22_09940 [Pseudidiomarina aestuarii]
MTLYLPEQQLHRSVSAIQHTTDRLEAALELLLENASLTAVFQPIVDIDQGPIVGYEALIRGPEGHPLHRPLALFDVAKKSGREAELEVLCREIALQQFARLELPGLLFLNANPNTLTAANYPQGCTLTAAKTAGIDPTRIVIELSEQHPVSSPDELKRVVHRYQQAGFKIALDDLGSAYSGLTLWAELEPDYIKIDRHFIDRIDQQPRKREFVKSITQLARSLGATIIAEGVERADELRELQRMGIPLAQGYFLGLPQANPATQLTNTALEQTPTPSRSGTIGELLESVPTIAPQVPCVQVLEYFSRNKELLSLPVVEGDRVLGGVRREQVLEIFSSSYGRALYASKPVHHIMERNPLIVDATTPIEEVSQLMTEDEALEIHRQILITQDKRFVGTASVRNVLRQITEVKIQNARYANPLTLLPGNVPIYREIDRRLQQHQSFYVAYFDLNNFKPYNDLYGYGEGDRILQWLGHLLQKILTGSGTFVGHIGGDDFVAIFSNDSNWRALLNEVLEAFKENIGQFYRPQDLTEGCILGTDRDGTQKRFPLLALAIGVAAVDPNQCQSHDDVAALASLAKKGAKQHDHCEFWLIPEPSQTTSATETQ